MEPKPTTELVPLLSSGWFVCPRGSRAVPSPTTTSISPIPSCLEILGRRGTITLLIFAVPQLHDALQLLHHTDSTCTSTASQPRRERLDEPDPRSEPGSLTKVALRSCPAAFPCCCPCPCSTTAWLMCIIPSQASVIAGLSLAVGLLPPLPVASCALYRGRLMRGFHQLL